MFEALYEIIKDHKITHRTRFHKETYVNDVKDTFVHMDMGTLRSLAKKYGDSVTDNQWKKLMTHEYHEFRMLALLILMQDINCHQHLKKVYHHYITYIDFVNNWDLVDVSAPNIVGRYVFETNNIHILNQFACAQSMWVNRIASVSCLFLIRKNQLDLPLRIIKKLLQHPHDLMHKANGWMLREVGKQNRKKLNHFLKDNYPNIPRTTLRYAIERHDKNIRKKILGGNFKWL